MKVEEILYHALRDARIVQYAGRGPDEYNLADALWRLNTMLDSWNAMGLAVPGVERDVWPVAAGVHTYTLGQDADWSAPRPGKIERAGIIQAATETPIDVLDWDRWADVGQKDLASVPTALYDDAAHPHRVIRLYPVPTEAMSVALYVWRQLRTFATIEDQVNLPPGYLEAITSNLAVRIAPTAREGFAGVSNDIRALANDSLATLKRRNIRTPRMACDSAILSIGNQGSWDIRTGDWR